MGSRSDSKRKMSGTRCSDQFLVVVVVDVYLGRSECCMHRGGRVCMGRRVADQADQAVGGWSRRSD